MMMRGISSLMLSRPAFRTYSVAAKAMHGKAAQELSQKLKEEFSYEQENMDIKSVPSWLADFKKSNMWKIQDSPGEKEVCFSREFGNEKIRALFSIDALDERNDDMDDFEPDSGGDAEESESGDSTFPVNMTIIVEKSGTKEADALEITAQVSDAAFYIENVAYNKSAKLMADESAEADWVRRGHFGGPNFADLDEGVQDVFHKYLEERGFDQDLAAVVPQYIEYKEQTEYMRWLDQVSKFVAK